MRQISRIAIMFAVLGLGVWLFTRTSTVTVEPPARQQAVMALGPVGAQAIATSADAEPQMRSTVGELVGVISPEDMDNAPAPDPQAFVQRYLAGEIEVENFIDGPYSEAYVAELREASLRRAVDAGVQVDNGSDTLGGLIAIGVNTRALDFSTTSGLTPPDMEVAVGNDHVIEVVNSSAAFYSKSNGARVRGPFDLEPILEARGCPAGFYFDPVAVYDDQSERYVISIMVAGDVQTDWFCIAVSQTSNPFGSWNVYAIDCSFGTFLFCDNHEIAAGYEAIYIAADMFGVGFPRVFAIDKAAMYAGAPSVTSVSFDLSSFYFNLRPVKMYGFAQGMWPANSSESHYFVATDYGGGGDFQIWRFNDPFGSASFPLVASLNTQTHGFPVSQPQLGGNSITANDDRLVSATYADGSIWAAHQVGCNPGGGTVNCIHWYEVDVSGGSPALLQDGIYSSSGEYRSYPDIAANSCGEMATAYTKFSASTYPSVYVAGRASGTPANQLIGEAALHIGSTAHSCYDSVPYRWGDYSDVAIDPVDGKTFWVIGQYAEPQASCDWATRLVSFTTASCAP